MGLSNSIPVHDCTNILLWHFMPCIIIACHVYLLGWYNHARYDVAWAMSIPVQKYANHSWKLLLWHFHHPVTLLATACLILTSLLSLHLCQKYQETSVSNNSGLGTGFPSMIWMNAQEEIATLVYSLPRQLHKQIRKSSLCSFGWTHRFGACVS